MSDIQEESGLVAHARRELALINNDADFNESIIKAVQGFVSYGHSGGSAPVAIAILNDLLQWKNLSPLTDDPEDWIEVQDGCWQNRRNGEAFSNDGGKHYYLLSEGGNDKNREPLHESTKKD